MSARLRLFTAAVTALAASAPALALAAPTAGLETTVSEAFHGGVVSDAWAGTSSAATFASGTLKVQIPAGAKVRKAYLVSGGIAGLDAQGSLPAVVATPRGVILGGSVASPLTFKIEGPVAHVDTLGAGDDVYWDYTFDATSVVRPLVETAAGGTASGAVVEIPIHERGDAGLENQAVYPKLLGHTLIVTYDLASAPLRNVTILTGAARGTSAVASGQATFAKPIANRCAAGSAAFDPFPVAAGVSFEYTAFEQDSSLRVNATTVGNKLGGSDDGSKDVLDQLWTAGSFGASAGGKPVGLKGDVLDGAPADGRLDDELYTGNAALADDATTATYAFAGNGNEAIHSLIFQTTAKVAAGDTDGDGVPDAVEGGCSVDTDGDGTPDLFDTDDDNDGIPTATELADAAAGKVSEDVDGDGKKNWLDDDADNDGVKDGDERDDRNGNGVKDYLERPGVVMDPDAGVTDAGAADAGRDASANDAGPVDAGAVDAGATTSDEGTLEGGAGCSTSPATGVGGAGLLAAVGLLLGAVRRRKG